jgi:hypothetical protein
VRDESELVDLQNGDERTVPAFVSKTKPVESFVGLFEWLEEQFREPNPGGVDGGPRPNCKPRAPDSASASFRTTSKSIFLPAIDQAQRADLIRTC